MYSDMIESKLYKVKITALCHLYKFSPIFSNVFFIVNGGSVSTRILFRTGQIDTNSTKQSLNVVFAVNIVIGPDCFSVNNNFKKKYIGGDTFFFQCIQRC